MPGYLPPGHFLTTAVFDPDADGDDDATAAGDTDHDRFAPDGSIAAHGASGLPQVQEVTDPNNAPAPEHDDLPTGVMFPIGDNAPAKGDQWAAGPSGPVNRTAAKADLAQGMAEAMAQADAASTRTVQHQDDFPSNRHQHGKYLRAWNNLAGLMHGLTNTGPMSQQEYGAKTGRPDLHRHYLAAYAQGYSQAHSRRADDGGQVTAALRLIADAWSEPRRTTDDFNPPYNSPQTSPDPWSANTAPQDSDYAAGHSAGQADRSSGEHPLFSDNSSGVSPYVKGYAEGYGGAQAPQGPRDVPLGTGGDSGQGMNAQEAQRAFQVARASRRTASADPWKDARDNLEQQHQVEGGHDVSGAPGDRPLAGEGTGGREGATWKTSSLRRVSAAFAPDSLMGDPEFRKGYLFASRWKRGARLVSRGSARFEAGLYSGITDRPQAQGAWASAHWRQGERHPELRRRLELHASFTRRQEAAGALRKGAYVTRQAGTMTDLVTDGPGTSPDPMGATPLNGPGSPPPMGGLSQPAAPGGAPPYQGTAPLPGGPVVPDDIMGRPQSAPEPSGPFTNTFSGQHPENALLAPVAPNTADSSGYTNPGAYQGDPHGRQAAFRARVQASLAKMGAQ